MNSDDRPRSPSAPPSRAVKEITLGDAEQTSSVELDIPTEVLKPSVRPARPATPARPPQPEPKVILAETPRNSRRDDTPPKVLAAGERPVKPGRKKKSRLKRLLRRALLLTGLAAGLWYFLPSSAPVQNGQAVLNFEIHPTGTAPTSIFVNGKPLPAGQGLSLAGEPDRLFQITILRQGFRIYKNEFRIPMPAAASSTARAIVLEPEEFGLVSLRTAPNTTTLITDQAQTWKLRGPMERLRLPPGDYVVQFKKRFSIFPGKKIPLKLHRNELRVVADDS